MTDLRKDLFTTGKILKTVSLCLLFSISSGQLSAEENWYDFSLDWIKPDTSPEGKVDHLPVTLEDNDFGKNTEQHYPPNQVFTLWVSDESLFQPDANDTVEVKQVLEKETKTHKLENKVPPIGFRSGVADIPDSYVERLRTVLNEMKSRKNVRLHFVGHTDSDKLSPALQAKYGNNVGLSRSRAQMAAEYFQQALDLAPDSVSFDGVGDSKPLASNATADGRRKNRRVEIQVWYDEINEKMVDKAVVIKAEKLNRLKVCREETVCQLTYKEGTGKRIRLKNLVKPLRRNVGETGLTDEFMRQITEAYKNLRGKQNVIIHFVGHTDNMPLDSAERRIYGDHTNLSKARARYVALEVQSRMGLPNRSISSTGKGSQYPVSSNGTEKGRFLNRRVEVEFWYDDPFEEITEAPQACPEVAGSETITLTYDPLTGPFQPVYFTAGQPVIPPGLTNRIRRTMDEIKDKANVRVSFIGYTNNERLSRRVADVYGDDLGLSTARARRTMQLIQKEMNLKDGQVEFIGRGFVHSDDVVSDGFTQLSEARVEIKILYDELALMEDQENLTIDRLNREAVAHNPYSLNLMRITVDGDPVYDMNKSSQDIQRCTDVALDDAKIQFRFNNLQVKPRLSITAWPDVIRYQDDVETDVEENRVYFKTYSNYSSFVKKAEIRLFNTEQSITSEPLFVVPVDKNNQAEWFADFEQFSAHTKKLNFVLRVYLDDEKYDETRPQPLWIVDNLETTQIARSDALKDNAEKNNQLTQGYGENQLVRQQAYINGGTVTVNGSGIPAGHKVWLAGKYVPVNENGEFVAEEILPKGQHTVEVAVLDQEGNGELYLRDLAFNKNDWFYVALGDLTVAKGNTTGPAQLVTQNESQFDEEMNVNGRFAYFTEGEFGDGWKLISSADTREGKVDELFTNFLDKDPRALFRRLDPDLFYPSFADDSSIEEKAPTSGKLYLKLQNDKDYGLLGNFTVDYMDTRLSQVDRGLYGINLHLESDDFTSFGEQKFMIDAFGAEPGTVAGRDEFRSTGGSLYFLQNQDVLMGSERLRVEIRDKDSGIVIGVKNLTPALDYDVDYIQGRIMLSQPLASFAEDSLIRAGSSVGGNPVYLIARYEYTPGFDEIDDLAFGLRSHYWFNDNFKMGVTFNKQEMDLGETRLDGVDFTLRKSADTWLKVESASSMGAGSTAFASNDGGFGFSSIENGFENGLLPDEKKKALHIEAN
ncbi:MAG: OmpA family protein, partial [Gammaproteobacteria bacterium]|nr:OmpA family protein [Gammaproteobacteria bacterium]